MNNQFKILESASAVINIKENPDEIFILYPLVKLEDLQAAIVCQLLGISSLQELEESKHYDYKPRKKWLDEGIACEILTPGAKGWETGRIRVKVSLEFCSDNSENNLNSYYSESK
jgi:KGK domain